jgi:hypothetical protein
MLASGSGRHRPLQELTTALRDIITRSCAATIMSPGLMTLTTPMILIPTAPP